MEKKLIIRKTDLKPSRHELSVLGVFNPAVVKVGTETIMLARVAEMDELAARVAALESKHVKT